MKVVLFNPPLIGYRRDFFGHIPSIPVGLLYVAAATREAGHEVEVLDAFALKPRRSRPWLSRYELSGLLPDEAMARIAPEVKVLGLSAHSGMSYRYFAQVIALAKARRLRVVVGGPFASTLPQLFLQAGADEVIVGEGERSFPNLLQTQGKPEISKTDSERIIRSDLIEDLDALAYPAYDLIDLTAYEQAGRSHGPLQGRYLPLITSRGCPYNCAFCATPAIGGRKWRARSAAGVVAEVAAMRERYQVSDFHIQDDNFTTSPPRVEQICEGLQALHPAVSFCLPSAVKSDNVTPALLDRMQAAGLRYIAFSPESGSERVRGLMEKQVDVERLVELIEHSHRAGLASQACFVLGFPGETDRDRQQTRTLFRRLVRAGVDDVSFFIMAPVPGSQSEGSLGPVPEYEGFNWSPRWRPDYSQLDRYRRARYREFFGLQLLYHPGCFLGFWQGAISGRYRTKGEMTIGWWLRRGF